MLSKKYKAIKKVLTSVSKVDYLHRKLLLLSKMYLDIDRGYRFSYMPDENGELEFMAALKEIYKDSGFVFFDVGAHVGTYTDMVLDFFKKYQGHLFDLSKTTLDFCIQRHGNNNNLTINNLALTDSIGEVEYRFYPKVQMQNGISGVGPYVGFDFELRKAPATTGDDYCAKQKIDRINLLKIDTEGYDLHVIRGFDQMLSSAKIDVIQFEYNIKSSETHSMLGDFYDYLLARGYVVGVLRKQGVVFRDFFFTQNDFNEGPNFIACLPSFREALENFSANNNQ